MEFPEKKYRLVAVLYLALSWSLIAKIMYLAGTSWERILSP
jgi:hypothetical protein